MFRKMRIAGLAALTFTAWLLVALGIRSLGSLTPAPDPYYDWYDSFAAAAPDVAVVVPLTTPAETDEPTQPEHPLYQTFLSGITQAVSQDGALPAAVTSAMNSWGVHIRSDNYRLSDDIYDLANEWDSTKVYKGLVTCDVTLTQDGRSTLLPDIRFEAWCYVSTWANGQTHCMAILMHTNDTFMLSGDLLGVAHGDTVHLYDRSLQPADSVYTFPELQRAHEVVGLATSERLGTIAIVRMGGAEYLYLPGDGDMQPYLLALVNPADHRRNPRFADITYVTSFERIVEGSVTIEEFGGRYILIHCTQGYFGQTIFCDLETESVYGLDGVFGLPLYDHTWNSPDMVVLYEFYETYRGPLNDSCLAVVYEDDVIVQCGYVEPTVNKNALYNFFYGHSNFDEFAEVGVTKKNSSIRTVTIADSLFVATLDFAQGSASLDTRDDATPAAISPSGRYRLHSVFMGPTYSCESSTTEWYVEDTHADTFRYIGDTYDYYGAWFGFVDDDILYRSYDWENGVALYSTATGEPLDWSFDLPIRHMTYGAGADAETWTSSGLMQAIFDPLGDQFVTFESGEYITEVIKGEYYDDYNVYAPLLVGLYNWHGQKTLEVDTGLFVDVDYEWGADEPTAIALNGTVLSFTVRQRVDDEWRYADCTFDIISGALDLDYISQDEYYARQGW